MEREKEWFSWSEVEAHRFNQGSSVLQIKCVWERESVCVFQFVRFSVCVCGWDKVSVLQLFASAAVSVILSTCRDLSLLWHWHSKLPNTMAKRWLILLAHSGSAFFFCSCLFSFSFLHDVSLCPLAVQMSCKVSFGNWHLHCSFQHTHTYTHFCSLKEHYSALLSFAFSPWNLSRMATSISKQQHRQQQQQRSRLTCNRFQQNSWRRLWQEHFSTLLLQTLSFTLRHTHSHSHSHSLWLFVLQLLCALFVGTPNPRRHVSCWLCSCYDFYCLSVKK